MAVLLGLEPPVAAAGDLCCNEAGCADGNSGARVRHDDDFGLRQSEGTALRSRRPGCALAGLGIGHGVLPPVDWADGLLRRFLRGLYVGSVDLGQLEQFGL